MHDLSSAFTKKARPMLSLIDDLRKIGVEKEIPIPQIAGDQSSGKSSVLESISGIQFPRGSGLCTRCPTQVTMTQGSVRSAKVAEWTGSVEKHIRELTSTEESEIPSLIESLTDEHAGNKSSGGFSSSDMYIEIK